MYSKTLSFTFSFEERNGDGFTGFFDGIDDPATYEPPGDDVLRGGARDNFLDGFLLGVNGASQVLEERDGDGFTGFFTGIDDPATYELPGESVFPGNTPFALSPGWGELTTFSGL